MPEEEERRPRRNDDRNQRNERPSGGRPVYRDGASRFGDRGPRREGGYNRDGGAPRREGGYNRDSAPRREGGYNNRDGAAPRREGGYNRDGGAPRREGGYNNRDGAPRREGGYNRDGGPRREGGYNNRDGAPRREGGYNRDGGAPRREGGYNRDGAPRREGGYNRDSAPPREGGFERERGSDRSRSFPQRGGAGRERPANAANERPRFDEPRLPDEVTARDLHPSARNELKTLSKENAEFVARHLAMASRLIDEDPALAHEHALAASRRAGRIAIVRETLGITAYATGDFALALRELRTYRRISGKDDQIALMVDSERGIGRPDRALETGRAVDRSALATPVRVALAIAMSGARLDQGDLALALGELEIPELDPDRAFEWSPALFAARAAVLEDLGRTDEAEFWAHRAEVAAEALGVDEAGDEELYVEDSLIEDEFSEAEFSEADVASVEDEADDATEADDTSDTPEPAEPSIEDEVRELLGEDDETDDETEDDSPSASEKPEA